MYKCMMPDDWPRSQALPPCDIILNSLATRTLFFEFLWKVLGVSAKGESLGTRLPDDKCKHAVNACITSNDPCMKEKLNIK